jgi:hypothetical protein
VLLAATSDGLRNAVPDLCNAFGGNSHQRTAEKAAISLLVVIGVRVLLAVFILSHELLHL